jgi:hypothetical protein
MKIYGAWVVVSLLYLALKPFDFPDANAPLPEHAPGVWFWLKVAFWEPVLAGMGVGLTALAVRWMKDGWLPLKTAAATLWTATPLALTLGYVNSGMPRWLFAILILAWLAPGAYFARRIDRATWRQTAAFLLGLNAVSLAALLPEIIATLLRSDLLYKASLGLSVFWLLACGGVGLRRLAGTSLARAILAFLFSNLVLNLVIAAFYLLHWLPKEVLKALVYV